MPGAKPRRRRVRRRIGLRSAGIAPVAVPSPGEARKTAEQPLRVRAPRVGTSRPRASNESRSVLSRTARACASGHASGTRHLSAQLPIRQQRRHLPLDAGHLPVDASISTWMPPGHLYADARCAAPGIQYWMLRRRRYAWSGQARPRDRSAAARSSALGSTSLPPASRGRGLQRRQRRPATRRSGRGESEAVAVPNRARRRGAPRF